MKGKYVCCGRLIYTYDDVRVLTEANIEHEKYGTNMGIRMSFTDLRANMDAKPFADVAFMQI